MVTHVCDHLVSVTVVPWPGAARRAACTSLSRHSSLELLNMLIPAADWQDAKSHFFVLQDMMLRQPLASGVIDVGRN